MKKATTVVFFASPGGGKDTHSLLLIKYLEQVLNEPVLYIGTGEEFRKLEKTNHTHCIVNGIMTCGGLVPDFLAESVVGSAMMHNMTPGSHVILNGFPRTVVQARKLSEMANFYGHNVKVVFIEITTQEAMRRIAKRGGEREDDNIESVKNRFKIFEKKNKPLVNYFKKNFELIYVDGDDTKEKVHNKIVKALKMGPPKKGKNQKVCF